MARMGRNRSGSLYRRWRGKEYAIEDKESLGEGVIWLRYMVDGKRLKKSLGTSDINEAKQKQRELMAPLLYADEREALAQHTLKLSQAQQTLDEITQDQTPSLSVDDSWDAYLKSQERPDTGDATMKYYAGYWTAFSKWLSASEPKVASLFDITPAIAQNYAVTLNRGKLSPNTFNKHIGFLKLLFRVLEEPARMKKNPFERISKKQLKTNVRRELTIAELKEIIKEAKGELQTLLCLGTFTGLRLGDCCTLKWGETDLDRGLIRRVPNKTAKSGKPVVVGIPEALHAKLTETPQSRRKGYVVPKYADLYTYRNASGRPTQQPDISNEIQKHFKHCGIQVHKEGTGYEKVPDPTGKHKYIWKHTGTRAVVEVGFHSLRHTWVSLQAEAGTPQAVVQSVIGHSNPAMTAHYTHIGEAAALKAAHVIDISEKKVGDDAKDPIPDWAKEQARELMKLANEITGKRNEEVRGDLLKGLSELV